MSLYHELKQLSDNEQTIFDLMTTDVIDYDTGEVIEPSEEDLAPVLDEINSESALIIEHLAEGILESEARAKFLKSREQEIALKRKRVESRIIWAKEYILNIMEVKQVTEIKGDTLKFKLSRSKYVDIQCPVDELPDAYIKINPETKSPNKIELAKALKSGNLIPGVEIGERSKVNIK